MVARSISGFSSELQNIKPSFERCRQILANVTSESSSAVMVLTVDVICDGSADGNEARAGREREETIL